MKTLGKKVSPPFYISTSKHITNSISAYIHIHIELKCSIARNKSLMYRDLWEN